MLCRFESCREHMEEFDQLKHALWDETVVPILEPVVRWLNTSLIKIGRWIRRG